MSRIGVANWREAGFSLTPVYKGPPDPDITHCNIVITSFMYYYLYKDSILIREITDAEYMEYRGLVKTVIGKENLI